jgi:hypothetical protein
MEKATDSKQSHLLAAIGLHRSTNTTAGTKSFDPLKAHEMDDIAKGIEDDYDEDQEEGQRRTGLGPRDNDKGMGGEKQKGGVSGLIYGDCRLKKNFGSHLDPRDLQPPAPEVTHLEF